MLKMREVNLSPTREALLHDEDASRRSPEHAYSSDSEIDNEELENFGNGDSSLRLRGGWSPRKGKQNATKDGSTIPKLRRKGGWLRNKKWWVIGAVLLGALVGALGGVYGRVFKKIGLQDGVSPALDNGTQDRAEVV